MRELQESGGLPPTDPQDIMPTRCSVQAISYRIASCGTPAALGQDEPMSPSSAPQSNFAGLLAAAKTGLSAKNTIIPKGPPPELEKPKIEIKKTESDLQLEQLERNLRRPLKIKDLDSCGRYKLFKYVSVWRNGRPGWWVNGGTSPTPTHDSWSWPPSPSRSTPIARDWWGTTSPSRYRGASFTPTWRHGRPCFTNHSQKQKQSSFI